MCRMRRDDVSDYFLYINEIRYKKIVSNPSRAVALAEHLCVYWMGRVGWGGANSTSENIRAVQSHLVCYPTAAI